MTTMSDTLLMIMKDKEGFRTEHYGGSGERDFMSVVEFEIIELCNTDILEFLQENYGMFPYLDLDNEDIVDPVYEQKDEVLRDIKYFVESKLGSYPKCTVWLTDMDGLNGNYKMDESEDYCRYFFSEMEEGKDFVILSDIGDEGVLITFKEYPDVEEIY